jgi:hypothetical protein
VNDDSEALPAISRRGWARISPTTVGTRNETIIAPRAIRSRIGVRFFRAAFRSSASVVKPTTERRRAGANTLATKIKKLLSMLARNRNRYNPAQQIGARAIVREKRRIELDLSVLE